MNILDMYEHEGRERDELMQSWSNQLDVNGMQPHSREHLEHEMNYARSMRKYDMVAGEMMDYAPGIQFSGSP